MTVTNSDELVLNSFRRWGHLQARLDPLGRLEPQAHPELEASGRAAERARAIYCGSIGVEFMHIPVLERVRWIQERMEGPAPEVDQTRVLERLVSADIFEKLLQTRYVGAKRFSLEGSTALIPLLDEILLGAVDRGARQALLAMSHRGRLNVLHHTVGVPAEKVIAGFEDHDPRSVLGSGDVKYHLGATGDFIGRGGRALRVHLASNPSHLEAVNPVAMGRTRAKQARAGRAGPREVLPIVVHGDAAFAGQGVAAETLNMSGLSGYTVGGTINVVVNNLIGFTTGPENLHWTRYATDMALRSPIPVFHVNGEDPEAVVRAGRLALEYRYTFGTDVVIDLIGYRRHGHSEVEDPTTTQPVLYAKIAEMSELWQSYARRIGAGAPEVDRLVAAARADFESAQEKARAAGQKPVLREMPAYWDPYQGGEYDPTVEVETQITPGEAERVAHAMVRTPDGFQVHPKIQRLLQQRVEMGEGRRPLDWGMAELLAFGTLADQGIRIRLSGEDVRRGTFNQRHAALTDVATGVTIVPLARMHDQQGPVEIIESPLSEFAVLGFEYGYSRDYPEALVLWEAQFGDFANGAQTIIDQFVFAGENKWQLLSGLVLLLPHGYDGQGPEHSSARLERFLQGCARGNVQVCQPTTAAQHFHLLRRQLLCRWRKPLLVLTPKSMLRLAAAASPLADLTTGRFQTILPDVEAEAADTILVCTGKVAHELREARKKRAQSATAIVTLEQIYPFPARELAAEFQRHPGARQVVWVQEEPANMGALSFVKPRLARIAGGRPVRQVSRSASASPATSSIKAHAIEQSALMNLAFVETIAES